MKGISSVITVVLLTSVSVALASMYAGWAPDLAGNLTSRAVEGAEQSTKCQSAGLSIQNPYYDPNSGEVFLTLKNTGTITFSKRIEIIALNITKLGSTKVFGLNPGESQETSFAATGYPDRVLARPLDCPNKVSSREDIEVRN